METNSKGKRMVFEEDIKYLQELKGENISSKTVGRVVDTEDITTLSDEVCNALKSGDIVNKVDSTGKHSYRVSYKKDEVGMCLTYSDASCVETVSYDYTAGHWVYNSKDVTTIENMNKMEKIKDKSGHLRFIEGSGDVSTIADVENNYCKWSLSGTHLMLVHIITLDVGASLSNNLLSSFELPNWIMNKIVSTGTEGMIASDTFISYSDDLTTGSLNLYLKKETNSVSINLIGSASIAKKRYCKIKFDLIIDNE